MGERLSFLDSIIFVRVLHWQAVFVYYKHTYRSNYFGTVELEEMSFCSEQMDFKIFNETWLALLYVEAAPHDLLFC